MRRFTPWGILGIWLVLVAPVLAAILPFGYNKVPYRQFEWRVFETPHFEIYHYPEGERLARQGAIMAERAFERITKGLDIHPFERTPLFFYRNQPEFQQTHIIPGYIGEGTGGVTEALKNRIVIPAGGSRRRTDEVVQHEFVHRLQFEMLYGGFAKSLKLLRSVFVPLWLAEGMAEYFAVDEDPSWTAMLLRDAAVTDRLRSLEQLDNFNHLDGREVVLGYKMGQSAFEFMAREFGVDKPGALLREYQKPQMTITQALRYTVGMDIEEFSEKWQAALKERSWQDVIGRQPASAYGRLLTPVQRGLLTYFSKPVWMPDQPSPGPSSNHAPVGQRIVYFSDYENFLDINVLDLKTFQATKLLGLQFEGVSTQGHGLTVSPDGKTLVFSAVKNGLPHLFFFDLTDNRLDHSFQGDFEWVASPAFSPDGAQIAFMGRRDGQSDIYVMKADGTEVRQITRDEYEDDAPHWSPDGKKIVYVTERDTRQIALVEPMAEAPQIRLLTQAPYEHLTPWWGPAGDRIYYSSDEQDSRYNLYVIHVETGEIRQLTETRIGLFSPRPSPDGRSLLYTSYENGSQLIYLMPEDRLQSLWDRPVARWMDEAPTQEPSRPPDLLEDLKFKPEHAAEMTSRPYQFSPSVDLVYFLFGYDSISGFVGGGYMAGSDLLGEHQFEIVANAFREFTNGYQLTYLYLPWRVSLGARVFGWKNLVPLRDPLGQDLGRIGSEVSGGALLASYPFDRYVRLDAMVTTEFQSEVLLDVSNSKRANVGTLSLIQDRRVFYSDEPIAGVANNMTVQRAERVLGGTDQYTNVLTEHQFYIGFTREMVWASRFFMGWSFDSDPQSFVFGGLNTLRGYAFREFSGKGVGLMNHEFRFPIQPQLNLTLWPLNWLLLKRLKGAIFLDTGLGWNDPSRVNWGTVKSSIGVGLRLHSFLLQSVPLIIRFDIAKRLDTSQPEVYYVAVGHVF